MGGIYGDDDYNLWIKKRHEQHARRQKEFAEYGVKRWCPRCQSPLLEDDLRCFDCGLKFGPVQVFEVVGACPVCGGDVIEEDACCPHCHTF